MPANGYNGVAERVVQVSARARYSFTRTDTYAAVSAVPANDTGTTLVLPAGAAAGDRYEFACTDGSCGAAAPIVLETTDGTTIAGESSALWENGYAWGVAIFQGGNSAPGTWMLYTYTPPPAQPENYYQILNVVTQFGADPTGLTDSTSQILAALAMAAALGGAEVLFPPGRYTVDETLPIPLNTTLRGAGREASIIQKTTPGDILLSSHALNTSTAANITVRDLGVQNLATQGLANWAPGTRYAVGTLLQVVGCRVLQCVSGGVSGSFRPIGQLSWVTQYNTPAYIGPAVTLSGAPTSTLAITIMMLSPTTFQWSTNGGVSWTGPLAIGSAVALAGTGLTANFAAGTYVTDAVCCSPSFGWSLIVGTTIQDGTASWEIVDGGGGFTDVGGSFITLRHFAAFNCTSGIILDQTEIATIDDINIGQAPGGGFALIWLCNGGPHSPLADYGFTNAIAITNFNLEGGAIGICDDGGTSHYYGIGGNIESQTVAMAVLAGVSTLTLQDFYAEATPTSQFNGYCYQLQNLGQIVIDSGYTLLYEVEGCSVVDIFGCRIAPAGGAAAFTMTGLRGVTVLTVGSNTFVCAPAAFVGCGNIELLSDVGGNVNQLSSPIYDANPVRGTIASSNTGGTYNVGITVVNGTVSLTPTTAPAAPATAGAMTLYVDTADNKLKAIASTGTITDLASP